MGGEGRVEWKNGVGQGMVKGRVKGWGGLSGVQLSVVGQGKGKRRGR